MQDDKKMIGRSQSEHGKFKTYTKILKILRKAKKLAKMQYDKK